VYPPLNKCDCKYSCQYELKHPDNLNYAQFIVEYATPFDTIILYYNQQLQNISANSSEIMFPDGKMQISS
jgi:hypothetical protein